MSKRFWQLLFTNGAILTMVSIQAIAITVPIRDRYRGERISALRGSTAQLSMVRIQNRLCRTTREARNRWSGEIRDGTGFRVERRV